MPNLGRAGYKVTSPKDKRYNCVAWAVAADQERWWEPRNEPGCFWPKAIPMAYTLENYVKVFELFGYASCHDASLIAGFEKVAIYQDYDGSFTHVARQLPAGTWISKLGRCEDIEHNNIDALTSTDYGVPAVYLQRKIAIWRRLRLLVTSLLSRLRS